MPQARIGVPIGMALRTVLALLLCIVTIAAHAAEIRVSAAISLSDVLRELAAKHERATGDRVVFNFGASSLLARQIIAGAPADLFLSADELQMNVVADAKLVRNETRRSLVSNTLVVVVPTDSRAALRSARDLLQVRRIALANPASVPAGIYAKAYLTRAGLWSQLEPKVIPVENVRAALAAVESGNVDCGIVYRTDARVSRKVRMAYEVPAAEGPKIVYPAAILRGARDPRATRRFYDYLFSPAAASIFRRHGFLVAKQ